MDLLLLPEAQNACCRSLLTWRECTRRDGRYTAKLKEGGRE